ncbi:MAG TPA: zinc-binding dehydrogenase [Thermoleophilaceae bacterium]
MIDALEYRPSLPKLVASRALRRPVHGALRLTQQTIPRRPAPEWVNVRPRLSGICGSDQALLAGHASPYLGALTSAPFVLGHEVVGDVLSGPNAGARVVVEPALGCEVRGITPPCVECLEGRYALCRNTVSGNIAAGLQTGVCRDTGGGWSEGLVAHERQLHAVPDALPDEDAVLVEPLACAIHAVRETDPAPGSHIAVIGAGTIGLLVLAALRERASGTEVTCVAKYESQKLQTLRFGADHVTTPDRATLDAARITAARRLVGRFGHELMLGGFDAVLDCVGSASSLRTALSIARPRGRVMLVGMPGRIGIDLSLAWQRELEVRGVYAYRDDFAEALRMAGEIRPGRLIADGWRLRDHGRALQEARRGARNGHPKTVFDLREAA